MPVQLICHTKPYKNRTFKMMVLRDTLVHDSENWFTYQPFPVVSLFLCSRSSFIGERIQMSNFILHSSTVKTHSQKTSPTMEESSKLFRCCCHGEIQIVFSWKPFQRRGAFKRKGITLKIRGNNVLKNHFKTLIE